MTRPSSAHTLAQVTSQSWPVRMARGVVTSPEIHVFLKKGWHLLATRGSNTWLGQQRNWIQHDFNGFGWPNIYFRFLCTFLILTDSPFLELVTLCLSPSLRFHPDCLHWIQMVLSSRPSEGGSESEVRANSLYDWFDLRCQREWQNKNHLSFLPQHPPALQTLVALSNAIE